MHIEGRLIGQYVQMHRRRKIYSRGGCVRKYVNDIAQIVAEIPTISILDYGCGKGLQYTNGRIHKAWGVMPTLFDPGVPGIDDLPEGTFDGVICTGVLEHIPKSELDAAISNLVRYTKKWCFVIVGLGPTNKCLPNGRQAHVTLRPLEWWRDKIGKMFDGDAALWLGFESGRGQPQHRSLSRLR